MPAHVGGVFRLGSSAHDVPGWRRYWGMADPDTRGLRRCSGVQGFKGVTRIEDLCYNAGGHGCPASGHPLNHVEGRREATTETGAVTSGNGTAQRPSHPRHADNYMELKT